MQRQRQAIHGVSAPFIGLMIRSIQLNRREKALNLIATSTSVRPIISTSSTPQEYPKESYSLCPKPYAPTPAHNGSCVAIIQQKVKNDPPVPLPFLFCKVCSTQASRRVDPTFDRTRLGFLVCHQRAIVRVGTCVLNRTTKKLDRAKYDLQK